MIKNLAKGEIAMGNNDLELKKVVESITKIEEFINKINIKRFGDE